MYCPKCGKDNPDDAKFCRKCGKDLTAIDGDQSASRSKIKKKKNEISWEGAMGSLFMGIAFLVITGVLAFQPMGQGWWFWLFIPAFGAIGLGIAMIIRLEKGGHREQSVDFSAGTRKPMDAPEQSALPPKQTTFASEFEKPRYDTEMVTPPSVTEETTRHLEMESEGETTELDKD